ncbi:MAG TPA: hypothetical protein P5228_12570 [Bacteroidales bacterium]|nr:hypothetical protein [Bacteroidales bacterium]HRZ49442.1 hypothetical protein [Bacteroidales bacterium]
MQLFIGIDDTDNLETRGTGFRAREMAGLMAADERTSILGITRHQHFVHPDIPYTSHNGSACVVADTNDPARIWEVCSVYLKSHAAEGSDVGLALALPEQISPELIRWAYATKKQVVTMEQAYSLSHDTGIRLEGFTGNRQGIIGAIASVALRYNGNDGRFIATAGNFHLRDLAPGTYPAAWLLNTLKADIITDLSGNPVDRSGQIVAGQYLRPVLINGKCTILVTQTSQANVWTAAPKDIIAGY